MRLFRYGEGRESGGRRSEPALAVSLAVAAGCALSSGAAAQPTTEISPTANHAQWGHTSWTMEDGLPGNAVVDILIASDGYMWLATYSGLVRFDGVRFTAYGQANTPGLSSNQIYSLYEDAVGGIWVGHENGSLDRLYSGSFESLGAEDGLPGGSVWDLQEDAEGVLWVASNSGLGRITAAGQYEGFVPQPVDQAFDLEVDSDGQMWIGSRGGLFRYSDGAFSEEGFQGSEAPVPFRAPDGSFWVGSATSFQAWKEDGTAPAIQTFGRVEAISMDHDGRLVVGTSDRIWLVEGLGDGRARVIEEIGWEGDEIVALTADAEGNIWVGTSGSGLHRLRRKPVFRLAAGASAGAAVQRVVADGDGGVWFSTDCTDLNHFSEGSFELIDTNPSVPPFGGWRSGCIESLLLDGDSSLWFGHGGNLYSLSNNGLTKHAPDEDLELGRILALHQDRRGQIWVGTCHGGVARFAGGAFNWFTTEDGLPSNQVVFIREDSEGSLWLGTGAGASKLVDGLFENYGPEDGLSRGVIRAIHEDSEGTLWFGSYGGGLTRFRDGVFRRFTQQDGLADDFISSILEDAEGNLWMHGNHGISQVNLEMLNAFAEGLLDRLHPIAFGLDEGMFEGNGGGQPSATQTADGKMWFASLGGLTGVDSRRFRPNRVPPKVRIEGIVAGRRTIAAGDAIELHPRERDLEIRYTGLSFVKSEEIHFRYRLEGAEDRWTEAGTRRVALYPDLSPGEYVFRVQAVNTHGTWSAADATVEIVVMPRFYETRWFVALGVLFIGLLGYMANLARTRRLVSRNLALERVVAERTEEVVHHSKELEKRYDQLRELEDLRDSLTHMIVHDLGSPLFGITAHLSVLQNQFDPSSQERQDLDAAFILTQSLTRMTRSLLDVTRMESAEMPLDLGRCDLGSLVADSVASLAILLRDHETTVNTPPEEAYTECDRSLIRRVVANLVGNAVSFTPKGGHVTVDVNRIQGRARVSIKDTGPGIPEEHRHRIFDKYWRVAATRNPTTFSTGLGLAFCRLAIDAHGGSIGVDSQVGKGSTFWFELPLAH